MDEASTVLGGRPIVEQAIGAAVESPIHHFHTSINVGAFLSTLTESYNLRRWVFEVSNVVNVVKLMSFCSVFEFCDDLKNIFRSVVYITSNRFVFCSKWTCQHMQSI